MEQQKKSKMGKFSPRLGITLVLTSFILYGGVLIIPFLALPPGAKVAAVTVLAVSGEVSFWVGGILLGKKVIARHKRHLNPLNWFRK